jgi:hypothetical protein
MRRLNLTFFVELGSALKPLSVLPRWVDQEGDHEAEFSAFNLKMYECRRLLGTLLQEEVIPLAIPASRPNAEKLLELMKSIRKQDHATGSDVWDVYWHARTLETLLHGELAVQSVYHIWPKRAFDTNLLIDKATALFSPEVQAWFTPDETYNIEQAGKCIAFETPTAAGFHLIRAAESVIRRYYAIVVGTVPAVKARNWGAYIKKLREHGADPKILHALEQIKDLHRNPVVHPEVQLSLEEAVSLVGITESIVSAIFADIAARKAAQMAAQPSLALVASGSSSASQNKLAAHYLSPSLDEPIPF